MSWWQSLRARFSRPAGHEETAQDDLPPARWLVIGLGNPGATYELTRHNVGYLVLEELLARHHGHLRGVAGVPAQVSRTAVDGHGLLLVRSTTYMNQSGLSVAPLAASAGIPADHVIVIHDELDLPAGTVKVKLGGNENGHNGLKSVSAELGTRDYVRIRVGIGRPAAGQSVVDHVLEAMSPQVRESLAGPVHTAADAVEIIAERGVPAAQNEIHGR
ncbi:aminoacyl-tRNA hydrolase [Corynebacterium terpenotabidum]|uniref:Peptidyl-tRNA hydrolase n=1 Tax=Corynebacterium terpenotabidum Y-11 TaxID=1200352 RepID=S4XKZ9_9CORY|nr:aminoacyl-tRNA hydrolase [Corynebacterium terpenotabidum]AGP31263.1 peptidyl-tRNA hydrolase [Corynebacterium terpenotabidum Y-11]